MSSIRIEAENMVLATYLKEIGNSAASATSLISLNNAAAATGSASATFLGPSGTYDVVIGYFDERDGVAQLDVLIAGQSLSGTPIKFGEKTASGVANSQTFRTKTFSRVFVGQNTAIQLQGIANLTEWARVDYIEFIPVSSLPPAAGTLDFSAPSFSINEDGTAVAAVTVSCSSGTAGAVSATVTLTNGTATAPEDYNNAPIIVSFADGETSKIVSVPIINDTLVEGKETLNLVLGSATGGAAIGTQNTAVLEVVDNDRPPASTSIRIEAEKVTLTNYRLESGISAASGRTVISLNGGTTTETGSASYTFTGPSGTYDVILGYYDEKDGVSNLQVFKGTTALANFMVDQNRGSTLALAQTLVPRKIAKGLKINQGETITITGTENSGEPVRVDYIEFIPIPSSTINGTNTAETLTGDRLSNTLNGFGDNDTFIGGAGNDKLNGGDGTDTASYAGATQGIIANLSKGVVFTPLFNRPLKLMPLGDSITYGVIDSSIGDRESGGYRTFLWNQLVSDSLSVDFVGSVTSGPSNLGDKNHEGHPGWKIQDIANNINSWLDTYKPDVIPLLIGTNDSNSSASTIAKGLGSLIDQITNRAPNAQLLVSTIPPRDPIKGNARAIHAAEYNLAISEVVKSKADQGKRVSFVDMLSDLSVSDLADGVHPNSTGYKEISDYWYDAILEASFDKDTLTSIENLVGSNLKDKIIGNAGTNVLEGRAGNDALTGGRGADSFVYRAPTEGLDSITDYGGNDIFQISAAGFGGGLQAGTPLSTSPTGSPTGVFFSSSNPTPVGSSANFLYNTSTGLLEFDDDGIGARRRMAIATLTNLPTLNASQFTIIT